jgi:hypothetical protein
MAKFLNTDLLNEWIPRLIKETEKELVIIVPYIKTSDRIYTQLSEANKRGVETTLVYRENKLPPPEREKLDRLDNLNLMHHPNVHAKCYYNEKYLIITSMNLYEYSELNNREMGILLEMTSENSFALNDSNIIADAIEEIRAIINGAQIQKESRETIEEGFEMNIIKTEKELEEEYCKKLNKIFVHKRFEVIQTAYGWQNICKNYFDKLNLSITDRRAELQFTLDGKRIEAVFANFKPHYNEYEFAGYKLYWNNHKEQIYLYPDKRHKIWHENAHDKNIKNLKVGIDQLIEYLRKFM